MKKYVLFILILLKTALIFSQGATRTNWLRSKEPNYTTNVNLVYPYSDKEYSDGNVNAIPTQSSFIDLIDFYGEGRIVDGELVSGFKKAYNINHQYQLVSNGPDRNCKIPNRIPVKNYNGDLNLSKYIANDKISTITLMRASIQPNTAKEMARMIRKDGPGKIIIYGFSSSDPEITVLEKELEKIGFYHAKNSILEAPFNEIRGFSHPPRVYKGKIVKVIGEQVFYSLNPKTNLDISQEDMVTLDYSSLLFLNADLSGGIKGKIDKPGGKINVEVYAYDKDRDDGIQKLLSSDHSDRNKLVYGAYSDITNVNDYVEKTTKVPYGFALNKDDGSYETLGVTDSNNVRLLGANSRSGWESGMCEYAFLRGLLWFGWKTASFYNFGKPEVSDPPCQKVITNIRTGTQPVLIKITIKDATLYDLKIPGIANNNVIVNFVDGTEGLKEYKIIKKLKVTVLESPNEYIQPDVYKEKIGNYIKETNAYYTAKTGNTKSTTITAEIGNPRILFRDVDLIIKKGSRESYNYQIKIENNALESETRVNENDDKTMQLIYIHSITKYYPKVPSTRVIRGVSRNGAITINNSDYTAFSYSRMFRDVPTVYGSPGATLAHEFGHYFNLEHPFEGGCSQTGGGDHVSDTPPAEGALWYLSDPGGPNERGINNPCQNPPTCNGLRRQIENIMDYGPCRWLFTKGQADRMTNRINTVPSLFNTVNVYDSSVDPNDINIVVYDQRRHDLRKKREVTNDNFSIKMLYPDSETGDYTLEIVSDKPEKATIQIFNILTVPVYENNISVKKGLNNFPIASSLFKESGLYILSYANEHRIQQIKFLYL